MDVIAVTQPAKSALIKKAASRVKDAARWLLDYQQRDLTILTDKQFTDLVADLAAVGKRGAGDILPESLFTGLLAIDVKGQASMMGAFQGWLKEQFKQARQNGSWPIDPNLMPHRTIDLFDVRARD